MNVFSRINMVIEQRCLVKDNSQAASHLTGVKGVCDFSNNNFLENAC